MCCLSFQPLELLYERKSVIQSFFRLKLCFFLVPGSQTPTYFETREEKSGSSLGLEKKSTHVQEVRIPTA